MDRAGLRRKLLKAQAEAGDIVLLFGDESEALKTAVAPGPAPIKAERALAVAGEVLCAPVADRPNWTLPRLADEIEKRSGMRISRSRLSVVLRQKGISAGDAPAAP